MKKKVNKKSISAVMSVAMFIFATHAGGGFATGNQVNNYYVSLGWTGIIAIFVSMLVLMTTFKTAIKIYNKNQMKSYKELFNYIFHPFEWLTSIFEIFFTLMVIMVISSSVSGSASAMNQYFSFDYNLATIVSAISILLLTIFGANFVRKIGSVMGIVILLTSLSVYLIGAVNGESIFPIVQKDFQIHGFSNIVRAIGIGFVYAGFQCVQIPGMLPVAKVLDNDKEVNKSMNISIVINTMALILSFVMLTSWSSYYKAIGGGKTLPTLLVTNAMGYRIIFIFYVISLIMCLTSTGVSITFGLVDRLENNKIFEKISNIYVRRIVIAFTAIIISSSISTVGLSNIIKYGYGYCGYLGIIAAIIPILIIGNIKYRKKAQTVSEFYEAV